MIEFSLIAVGFIVGAIVGATLIKDSKWIIYNPETFVYTSGIIAVLYNTGELKITRDRNEISWMNVRSYIIL